MVGRTGQRYTSNRVLDATLRMAVKKLQDRMESDDYPFCKEDISLLQAAISYEKVRVLNAAKNSGAGSWWGKIDASEESDDE